MARVQNLAFVYNLEQYSFAIISVFNLYVHLIKKKQQRQTYIAYTYILQIKFRVVMTIETPKQIE